ncbi:MAG: hypothetical protein IRZ28_11070 [Steroidobacteraceae bacterium]|nr:hypothetical protein [Steroidobacteraceae bacterium]
MTFRTLCQIMLLASAALVLGACRTPRTTVPTQHYVPLTRSLEPLGDLYLSNTDLQLTDLDGVMRLDYVGHMPETAGEDLAGASVYRVKNAQEHFKKNAGKPGYCEEPPRWVAVNAESGAPAWSRKIWVGLLTLEEWSRFTPGDHRACASGEYVRAQD